MVGKLQAVHGSEVAHVVCHCVSVKILLIYFENSTQPDFLSFDWLDTLHNSYDLVCCIVIGRLVMNNYVTRCLFIELLGDRHKGSISS